MKRRHHKKSHCKIVHVKGQGKRKLCFGRKGITSNTKAR